MRSSQGPLAAHHRQAVEKSGKPLITIGQMKRKYYNYLTEL